jgi:hypothetical protein
MYLVVHIEGMLQSFYIFFPHSPKKMLEFLTLAKILETKSLKLMSNIKTHRISMFKSLKRLLTEYKSLVVKMYMDASKSKHVRNNLDLLCDLELVLGSMHPSNVESTTHINQICSKVGCFYL